MKPQYSVSIIVPVYNVEKYIERCLKSIINQSYDGNIECLLVNDATKDKSIEVINRFLNEYDGKIIFKLIEHETNRGLSAARNTGIKNANGDFLYFLDSDDEISHDCIKLLMKSIESDTEMVQGNTKIIPKLDYLERYVTINDRLGKKISDHILIKQYMMLKIIPVTSWNKLVRRKFIIENKLYFEEGLLHEDEYWYFLLAKKLKNISFVNEYTYFYYMNEGSIVNSYNKKSFISICKIIELCLSNIDDVCKMEQIEFIDELLIRIGTDIIKKDEIVECEDLNQYLISVLTLYKKTIKVQSLCKKIILFQLEKGRRIRNKLMIKNWSLLKLISEKQSGRKFAYCNLKS